MATALPARNILDGTALPVTSQMKTALGSLRDYLAEQLGAAGGTAAARAGANSDITSLTGLTTDLSIAQGGTASSTATAACTALGAYQKSSILGTVSQTAGVPTGAIIERVSNANGQAIKLTDGTLICWASYTPSSKAITTAYGSVFVSAIQSITWPAAFSEYPAVSGGYQNAGGGIPDISFATAGLTTGSYYLTHPNSQTLTIGATIMAVGRWY